MRKWYVMVEPQRHPPILPIDTAPSPKHPPQLQRDQKKPAHYSVPKRAQQLLVWAHRWRWEERVFGGKGGSGN